MEKKVIQISTHSLSNIFPGEDMTRFLQSEAVPYAGGWNAKLTHQLRKVSDDFTYECWGMERLIDKPLQWERDGLTFRVFPSRQLKYVGELSQSLLHALKKEDKASCSLIEIHELFSWTTFLAPLIIRRMPIVVQHHGSLSSLQHFFMEPHIGKKLGYLLLYVLKGEWLFERRSLRKVAQIFVLSKQVEDYIKRFAVEGRIARLSMGIDFDLFVKSEKRRARYLLNLNPDERYVLFVGSLVRIKGLPYLLRALPTVLNEFPETTLLLVGQGYYKRELEKLARTLDVEKKVLFLPREGGQRISDDSLPLYYNAADVFVLPSVNEGLAVVGIEALACETPAVVTNVGGMADLVNNFKGGALVHPRNHAALANAIIDIFRTERPFRVDRENAKKYYDWRPIAEKNVEVYHELFDQYY